MRDIDLKREGDGEDQKAFDIHGVVGILDLSGGPHIIVILDKSFACNFDGCQVFRIDEVGVFSIRPHVTMSSASRRRDAAYNGLVKSLLEHRDFYFSYDLDITNTISRKTSSTYSFDAPHYLRFDQRFFWNRHMVKSLHTLISQQGQAIDFFLFSRRSRHRAGTRYRTRGADKHGNVANYVESEQIVHVDKDWVSFVQVRGSIPLLWSQHGKSLSPTVRIHKSDSDNLRVLSAHFAEQIKYYQRQLCVSLLDLSGGEAKLAAAYKTSVEAQSNKNLLYHQFDFHSETKGNHFSNAWLCLERLEDVLSDMNFHIVSAGVVKGTQSLVVRTNCLDCLDRTNLMQSFFAYYSLKKQLKMFPNINHERNDVIDRTFKLVWANNGDYVSRQYAGTSALKGDFTRTGRRDARGVMKDGVNSLSRYYINNFRDRQRQAAIDIFLGKYNYSQSGESNIVTRAFSALNAKQQEAIESSLAWIVEHAEAGETEPEPILGYWIVISFNKWGIEQERVFVVSASAYYRFKCDMDRGGSVSRTTRVPLAEIESISFGRFSETPPKYALALRLAQVVGRSQSQTYQVYSSMDFSADVIQDVLDTIIDARLKVNVPPIVEEKVEIKKAGAGSKIINSFKLGRYNKGSGSSPTVSPPPGAHQNRATAVSPSQVLGSESSSDEEDAEDYGDGMSAAFSALSRGIASQNPIAQSPQPEDSGRARPRSTSFGRNPTQAALTPTHGIDQASIAEENEGDSEVDDAMPTPPDSDDEWSHASKEPKSPRLDSRPISPRNSPHLSSESSPSRLVGVQESNRNRSAASSARPGFDLNQRRSVALQKPEGVSSPLIGTAQPDTPATRPVALSKSGAQKWDELSAELAALQDELTDPSLGSPRTISPQLNQVKTIVESHDELPSIKLVEDEPKSRPTVKPSSFDVYLIKKSDVKPDSPSLGRSRTEAPSHERQLNTSLQRAVTSPNALLNCPTCQLPVPGASSESPLEKLFHPVCFLCTNCKKQIALPGQYLRSGNKPFCLNCKEAVNTCVYCKKQVDGEAVRSSYGLFHPACFDSVKKQIAEKRKQV